MKKIIRTITALVLASIFLVSFTGIRLLVHNCAGCGTSEIVFAIETVSCCGKLHAPDDHTVPILTADHQVRNHEATPNTAAGEVAADNEADLNKAAACCIASEPGPCESGCGESCCDFESIYLKGEYDFTFSKAMGTILVPVLDIPADIAGETCDTADRQFNLTDTSFNDTPPKLSGRNFLLFAHQIKILA